MEDTEIGSGPKAATGFGKDVRGTLSVRKFKPASNSLLHLNGCSKCGYYDTQGIHVDTGLITIHLTHLWHQSFPIISPPTAIPCMEKEAYKRISHISIARWVCAHFSQSTAHIYQTACRRIVALRSNNHYST